MYMQTEPSLRDVLQAVQTAVETLSVKMDSKFELVDKQFKRVDERFDVVDELFCGVKERFDEMDERFVGMDQRFDGMDQRFAGMDQRFDGMDQRFAGMDQRFAGMDQRFDEAHEVVQGLAAHMDERFTKIEVAMVTKDYLDVRMGQLRGDLVGMVRKGDDKVDAVIDELEIRKVVDRSSSQRLKQLSPFPKLR